MAQALDDCGVQYEIIFVNDGSRDESAAVLDHLAAVTDSVRVVHLSRNFGHQAAVQAGLAHARGDAVVLMDSDMQDAPEAIGRFLAEWRAGYDVVYAVRTQRKEIAVKTVPLRRLPPADVGRGLGADPGRRRHLRPDRPPRGPADRGPGRDATAISRACGRWVGFRQTGIVVERNARYDGHPRVSLRGLFRLAKTAMFSFSSLPLTIFHVIGALAAVVFV